MDQIKLYHFNKIKKYLSKDYSHKAIIEMLKKKYNINISLRTFSRILHGHNKLRRKGIVESSVEEITAAILLELEGSGMNLGYRSMWQRLRKVYNLVIKQKTVLRILNIVDPDGIEARSRYKLRRRLYNVPGPNHVWHVDGHDKLKRYGFSIYGMIDGFSKKIVWLDVCTSNKNPQVIAYFYLRCIEKFGFLPTMIRSDHGTEVVLMEDMQMILRMDHDDKFAGEKSFAKGKSTHNQRIESYWRQFREHLADFYINLFKLMEHENVLDVSNVLHIDCLRYCFGDLLKDEILVTKKEWNEHRVRKQNSRNVLGGKPNELFHCPNKFGGTDCKKTLNVDHAKLLYEGFTMEPVLYSLDFKDLMHLILPSHTLPCTAEDAYNLYLYIIEIMESDQEISVTN